MLKRLQDFFKLYSLYKTLLLETILFEERGDGLSECEREFFVNKVRKVREGENERVGRGERERERERGQKCRTVLVLVNVRSKIRKQSHQVTNPDLAFHLHSFFSAKVFLRKVGKKVHLLIKRYFFLRINTENFGFYYQQSEDLNPGRLGRSVNATSVLCRLPYTSDFQKNGLKSVK